jgi:hypothetical protein
MTTLVARPRNFGSAIGVASQLFDPDLGRWHQKFETAAAHFEIGRADGISALQSLIRSAELVLDSDPQSAAAAFAASLVDDVVSAGGSVGIRDSRLWLQWPEWGERTPESDETLRRALISLRGTESTFRPGITPGEALAFVGSMTIELTQVKPGAPELVRLFQDGLSTWSMPYRGREGRSLRFVLFGASDNLRVPLGLLEVGDDAPLSTVRDRLLGFGIGEPGGDAFEAWAERHGRASALDAVADRLAAMRSLLLPVGQFEPSAPLRTLEDRLPEIRDSGMGRLGTRSTIEERKRLTYLSRLVAGELAMRRKERDTPGVRDALRVLRDLSVPRMQAEVTICGALPPFGDVLVGKLVASMFAHPEVRALVKRGLGEIMLSTFDPGVADLLPAQGAVIVTTKGLYAGHSAQYNNVKVPGSSDALGLRHAGNTVGTTTSLLSDQTGRLAELVLRTRRPNGSVSREYGSGGGKRQRVIEAAAIAVGIPERMVHPRLRRPVYVIPLVSNLADVALINEAPAWLIQPEESPSDYTRRALDLWKSRWLSVAQRRRATVDA